MIAAATSLVDTTKYCDQIQREHPGITLVSVIGKAAGEKWKSLSEEDKVPYMKMSEASKAEYARMKTLTPAERAMVAAAACMQEEESRQGIAGHQELHSYEQ